MSATAKDWTCRNTDMEVACAKGKCERNESFTPMSVELGHAGKLRICAYSGCWEGQGKPTQTAGMLAVIATRMRFVPPNPDADAPAAAVVVDQKDGIGIMKLHGYAQPLVCDSSR